MTVFLEPVARLLLFLHLVATFVLIGSLTHDLVLVLGYCRGRFAKKHQEKRFVVVAFWAYVVVFVLGALVYPTFRVRVRAELFDKVLPWATGIFEVKEHWAAIGLALFIAYYALRRSFCPETEREKLILYVPLCVLIYVITCYLIGSGFYVTVLKGV